MEDHFLLPESRFNTLNQSIIELKALLIEVREKSRELSDWVSEYEAQKILGLKETSLWNLRKRRLLIYSKIGSKTFYSVQSIEKLLQKNQR